MKHLLTWLGAGAGFIYGTTAVLVVYRDAPHALQAFIIGGVTLVGAGAAYLLATGLATVTRLLAR